MFDNTSRYSGQPTYAVPDHRGRQVEVVAVPAASVQALAGIHLLREGERIDHLAARYLDDGCLWWRICELNEAPQAAALTEKRAISIPVRTG